MLPQFQQDPAPAEPERDGKHCQDWHTLTHVPSKRITKAGLSWGSVGLSTIRAMETRRKLLDFRTFKDRLGFSFHSDTGPPSPRLLAVAWSILHDPPV